MNLLLRRITTVITILLIAIISISFLKNGFLKTIFYNNSFEEKQNLKEIYNCNKIVSLAPSITEMLFALDLDERIIGVTRFCKYPKEALTKKSVGGYIKPNYEIILEMKPSLIFILEEHEFEKNKLDQLEFNWVMLKKRSVKDILDSINTIGKICKVREKSSQLIRDLKGRIKRVKMRTQNQLKPRVLISLGRKMGTGSLKDAFVAGKETFYDDILNLAGGVNAFQKKGFHYPTLTREGLMRLNPEVIIDMISNVKESGLSVKEILNEWKGLKNVHAVYRSQVYVFGEDYVNIPGPRFILILENLARVIHPEVDWR